MRVVQDAEHVLQRLELSDDRGAPSSSAANGSSRYRSRFAPILTSCARASSAIDCTSASRASSSPERRSTNGASAPAAVSGLGIERRAVYWQAAPQPRVGRRVVVLERASEPLLRFVLPPAEPLFQPGQPGPLVLPQVGRLAGHPREMHLQIPARTGGAREPAEPAEHLGRHPLVQHVVPGAQRAPEPADRDPESVQRFRVLGMAQAESGGGRIVEQAQRQEAGRLGGGSIEERGRSRVPFRVRYCLSPRCQAAAAGPWHARADQTIMDACGIAFGAGCVPTARFGRSSPSPSQGLSRRTTSRGRRRNARPSGFTAWSRADRGPRSRPSRIREAPPPAAPPSTPAAPAPPPRPGRHADPARSGRNRDDPRERRRRLHDPACRTPSATGARGRTPLPPCPGRRAWTARPADGGAVLHVRPPLLGRVGPCQEHGRSAALPGRAAAAQARQGSWRGESADASLLASPFEPPAAVRPRPPA